MSIALGNRLGGTESATFTKLEARLARMIGLLLAGAVWEGAAALGRFAERRKVFAQAQARAIQTGKPLIVVGDPDAGAHTKLVRAYPCGDLCVDLTGCPHCDSAAVVDLTKDRIPVGDNGGVVFVSCVLEYVDDIQAAWTELKRVGGPDVFVVPVGGGTLTSWLFPGAKWILHANGAGGFTATRISNDPQTGAGL